MIEPKKGTGRNTKRHQLFRSTAWRAAHCLHSLRHGVAGGGWSLAALQAMLGHGTIAVTERYGTISEDLVEREALRLVQHRVQGGVAAHS